MGRRYHYPEGTVRWFRWNGQGDVRAHRPPCGWDAFAELIDRHPLTDVPLGGAQWWMRERRAAGHHDQEPRP